MLLFKIVDKTNNVDESPRRYLGNISVPHTSTVFFKSDGLAFICDSNGNEGWYVELTVDQYISLMDRIGVTRDEIELLVMA